MVPKFSSEVLPDVPVCKKVEIILIEKIHVLDKLCSGMHFGAVGCEFNVDELAIDIT
jgi:hypothetical protein